MSKTTLSRVEETLASFQGTYEIVAVDDGSVGIIRERS